MAVAKLGQEDEADTRDFALAALWEKRPATAITEARFWSGVGFEQSVARQQKVAPLKPARPRDELFNALRGESPAVFRFSTWDDADDARELTEQVFEDCDRDAAMKRVERENKRLAKERDERREEAGLW